MISPRGQAVANSRLRRPKLLVCHPMVAFDILRTNAKDRMLPICSCLRSGAKNIEYVTPALANANADIIGLPELAFTDYYFNSQAELHQLAQDPVDSQSVEALTAICREHAFYFVTGFTERAVDKVFNSALLIGLQGFSMPIGNCIFSTMKKIFLSLAISPCEPFKFVPRSLALQGVDVLCHSSNLVLTYCQQTMLSRCLGNGIYGVTCNRWGCDDRPHGRLDFTGQSQVVVPKADFCSLIDGLDHV